MSAYYETVSKNNEKTGKNIKGFTRMYLSFVDCSHNLDDLI